VITPVRFMVFAKKILAQTTPPEEEYRSAISRAYYCLYHEALSVLIQKYSLDLIASIERKKKRRLNPEERAKLSALDPEFLKQFNLHQIISDTLFSLRYYAVATMFKGYRVKRNQADYDINYNITFNDADVIVKNIDVFITAIKAL
jgi:uncharacterized protein (UPF0332 family)